MPVIEIEIDSPNPGDILGMLVPVFGTYTLTQTLEKKGPPPAGAAPLTLTGTITVTLLKNDGNPFPEAPAGSGSDTVVQNNIPLNNKPEGTDQPWSVSFQYNGSQHNDAKARAVLVCSSGGSDDDQVEEFDLNTGGGSG